jgi:hypothetical protein
MTVEKGGGAVTRANRCNTFSQGGSAGQPDVNDLEGPHSKPFLVVPIRQWDDAQAAGGLATLKRRFVQM